MCSCICPPTPPVLSFTHLPSTSTHVTLLNFLEFSRGQFHFPRIVLLLCWGLLKFSVVTVVSPFLVDTKILASLLLFPSYPLLPLKIPPSPKLPEKARSAKLSPPFVTRRGRARWAGKHWLSKCRQDLSLSPQPLSWFVPKTGWTTIYIRIQGDIWMMSHPTVLCAWQICRLERNLPIKVDASMSSCKIAILVHQCVTFF